MKKICGRCLIEKELSDFYKRKTASDGYQYYCKDCGKKYYKKWKDKSEESKNRYNKWKQKRIGEIRKLFREYMKDAQCIDCGYSNWVALEFDHVRGNKIAGVTDLINKGNAWEKVLEEIEKCEIRCLNCHRIKTAERGNWWTVSAVPDGQV